MTVLRTISQLFCSMSLSLSFLMIRFKLCILAGIPQKWCCVFLLHPIRQCTISICPIIGDVNFDDLRWCLPGVSTGSYFFSLCNKNELCGEIFWDHVSIQMLIKLLSLVLALLFLGSIIAMMVAKFIITSTFISWHLLYGKTPFLFSTFIYTI